MHKHGSLSSFRPPPPDPRSRPFLGDTWLPLAPPPPRRGGMGAAGRGCGGKGVQKIVDSAPGWEEFPGELRAPLQRARDGSLIRAASPAIKCAPAVAERGGEEEGVAGYVILFRIGPQPILFLFFLMICATVGKKLCVQRFLLG